MLWAMGQELGVCFGGNQEDVIKKLEAMEARDVLGNRDIGEVISGRAVNQVNP